ncbi:ribbon-helix-helix protein, CopG family [Bacteroides acidifaciens]
MEREQVTIRLPAELKERIQQKADAMGISFNALVIILLRKSLAIE